MLPQPLGIGPVVLTVTGCDNQKFPVVKSARQHQTAPVSVAEHTRPPVRPQGRQQLHEPIRTGTALKPGVELLISKFSRGNDYDTKLFGKLSPLGIWLDRSHVSCSTTGQVEDGQQTEQPRTSNQNSVMRLRHDFPDAFMRLFAQNGCERHAVRYVVWYDNTPFVRHHPLADVTKRRDDPCPWWDGNTLADFSDATKRLIPDSTRGSIGVVVFDQAQLRGDADCAELRRKADLAGLEFNPRLNIPLQLPWPV